MHLDIHAARLDPERPTDDVLVDLLRQLLVGAHKRPNEIRTGQDACELPLSSERAASYLCKYLTKDHPPWFLRTLKGPVVTVSRTVIAQSMCTMALLRKARRLWSARDGRCGYPAWEWETALKVGYLLDGRTAVAQGP